MDELNKSKKELDQLKQTLSKTSEVNKHLEKIEETFKTRENKLEKDVQEKLRFFKYEVSKMSLPCLQYKLLHHPSTKNGFLAHDKMNATHI